MNPVTGYMVAGYLDTPNEIMRAYYTLTEVYHQSTYGVIEPSSTTRVYDCELDATEREWSMTYWATINPRCQQLYDADAAVPSSAKPAASVFKHACL